MTNSTNLLLTEKDQNLSEMSFPHFATGLVVKGFGRGSKELGIPTANYPENVVDHLPDSIKGGVYYGLAQVDNGPVYRMVMSIGNNPYYNNEKRTMETYIMNRFENDFYGSILKTVMLGFIRKMENYKSLDELIAAINKDIVDANEKLDSIDIKEYSENPFFNSN